jgi:hypothetical protein
MVFINFSYTLLEKLFFQCKVNKLLLLSQIQEFS